MCSSVLVSARVCVFVCVYFFEIIKLASFKVSITFIRIKFIHV